MRLRFVFPPLLTGQYICDLDCCTVLPASMTAVHVTLYLFHWCYGAYCDAETDMTTNTALAAAVVNCQS